MLERLITEKAKSIQKEICTEGSQWQHTYLVCVKLRVQFPAPQSG